jgi:hypothetical protein
LLPRHGEALAPVLAQLGAAAVAAVPALLEAERAGALDRQSFAQTITGIGPAAGSPAVIARSWQPGQAARLSLREAE